MKISCGGLIQRDDLCLVEVLGFAWRPGVACGILERFGHASIPLSYLSLGNGLDDQKNMSFCVSEATLDARYRLLEEVQRDFAPARVRVRRSVSILTLYGPHFQEKTNLVSELFAALCDRGIHAHTVCSSVNSISVVVDAAGRPETVECLRGRFEWPE